MAVGEVNLISKLLIEHRDRSKITNAFPSDFFLQNREATRVFC